MTLLKCILYVFLARIDKAGCRDVYNKFTYDICAKGYSHRE